MNKTLCLVIAMAAMCCLVGGAIADDVYTFSGSGRSGGDVYDTMIAASSPVAGGYYYGSPTINYGGLPWWGANEQAGPIAAEGANTRSLIRFDVSDLAGLTDPIVSIEMRFYQSGGDATAVSAHEIHDTNSNWQEGSDTGSSSWPGWWNRTTWDKKLQGLGDASWWRFDFGWEQYGLEAGFDETPIATTTTSGSGWQSMFFTGNLDGLIAEWSLSPVDENNPNGRIYGIFADPEEFTVVDNQGLLISAAGPLYAVSGEGMANPDGYPDGELINPDGLPDGELIDPDGIPDSGDEFIAPDDSFTAPYDSFSASPELIVTVATTGTPGDFDNDGDVDADDINDLCANMGGAVDPYDVNEDGNVDEDDLTFLVETLAEWDNGVDTGVGTKQGDFNLDGVVNATDLAIMKGTFGTSGVNYADGNANCDTVVNATDLAILKNNFGFIAPTGGGVPEPVTIGLLSLGGLAMLRRRR